MITLTFELIRKWLLRAAWAPIAVLLVQQLFSRSYEIDWLMHLLGGAAVAFFFYQGTLVLDSLLDRPLPILRHLLAFGLTCGVVIAWELGELISDRLIGSRFQASIAETMGDQFCGALGSIVVLGCVAAIEHWDGNQIIKPDGFGGNGNGYDRPRAWHDPALTKEHPTHNNQQQPQK